MEEPTAGTDWQPIQITADRLAGQVSVHAIDIAALLRRQIASYAQVPVEELVPGVAASVTSGMAALAQRRGPNAEELAQVQWVAESRARQGIALASVIEAYHLGAHAIWDIVAAEASVGGAGPETLMKAANLLWRWTDAVTLRAASGHQRAGMEIVRHDQQLRTEFLRALLFGSIHPDELRSQGAAYRLSADRTYLPFQAVPSPGESAMDTERLITSAGSLADQPALVGQVEGSLAGVLARAPDLDPTAVTLVMGPAVDLAGVAPSYLLACRGLGAAIGFALPGVHRVEDLALQVAIASEEYLGTCLLKRYLEPLRALRGSGEEIAETVAAFLRAGMRVEDTARAGFVHPNTVRHRLRRFEQVTKSDLRRTQDIVGIWWALERRKLLGGG